MLFTKKRMSGSNTACGLPGCLEKMHRRAEFFRMFFEEAGFTHRWRKDVEAFMHGNADGFLGRR